MQPAESNEQTANPIHNLNCYHSIKLHLLLDNKPHSNQLTEREMGQPQVKEKVHQMQSFVNAVTLSDQGQQQSLAMAIASMGTLIQEIIVTASSMMFTCQKLALDALNQNGSNIGEEFHQGLQVQVCDDESYGPSVEEVSHAIYNGEGGGWPPPPFSHKKILDACNDTILLSGINEERGVVGEGDFQHEVRKSDASSKFSSMECEIIELDANDLLAKYTHHCQVCGKGFKRDANLRMHMRAHGDQYKTKAALSNPIKRGSTNSSSSLSTKDYNRLYTAAPMNSPRKYSCPKQGCRWNKKNERFQPLKSIVCLKNHYKRSHCPKMYIYNQCNCKQFSLLSDLRTHEKHCGDTKWQCSCGSTFSRKDKLMGHVGLFAGHHPVIANWLAQSKASEYI